MRYICCPFLRIMSPFYKTASCPRKTCIDLHWCGRLVWARKFKFKYFLTINLYILLSENENKSSLRVLCVVFADFARLTRKLFHNG